MTSDIFLRQDRIEAVATNGSYLGIGTGKDADPDIKLRPNWASLKLGGDGENSDGDIKLMNRPDEEGNAEPRIHLTGGKGGTFGETRVRVDGRVRQSAKRALQDIFRTDDSLEDEETVEALAQELGRMVEEYLGKRRKYLLEAKEDAEFAFRSPLGRIVEGFQQELGDRG